MGQRGSLPERTNANGGLDSARKRDGLPILPRTELKQTVPLLPFEHQLIATLGLTVEEYQAFTAEVLAKSRVRPAAYDHIPHVVNDPVSIIINLVIGIALSAASALLAPKPEEAQQQQKKLKNINQASRFNQTYGFDQTGELATYGDPIPLPFGRFRPATQTTEASGGLLLSTELVWSRMFSLGNHQIAKLLFAVGEGGLEPPDLEGIYIGNAPLDAVYKQQFALYWAKRDGFNRVQGGDLLYGTRGTKDSGDPQTNNDVFTCPTQFDPNDTGFCGIHSLSSQASFGCYSPIANGTAYRPNWRVIAMPDYRDDNDTIQAERRKIAGRDGDGDKDGMPGLGRGYSRRMAIIGHQPLNQSMVIHRLPTRVGIYVGDQIQFSIFTAQIDPDKAGIDRSTGITLDDVNDAIFDGLIAADDRLQVGELFMVARCVFQVVSRPAEIVRKFVKRKNAHWFNYTLKCIEVLGNNEIGVAGRQSVAEDITSEGINHENYFVGPSYFPLLTVAYGLVRNVRPADTIEIGIRSQVNNRAEGLCNFSAVPTPQKLSRWDDRNIQVQGGQMSRFFERTSVFTIHIRKAGLQPNGKPYDWAYTNEQFCITNNRPVDVYNYLRIQPQFPAQYEYRLVPRPGAVSVHFDRDDEVYVRLDAKSDTNINRTVATPYGTFVITTSGDEVLNGELQLQPEMVTDTGVPATGRYENRVVDVGFPLELLPTTATTGRHQGWLSEFLGDPHGVDLKTTRTRMQRVYDASGNRWIDIRVTATVLEHKDDYTYYLTWYTFKKWMNETYAVVDSSDDFRNGERVELWFDPGTNKFRKPVGARFEVRTQQVLVPPEPSETERTFESETGVADLSFYDELRKSNATQPEHTIVYVNETLPNDKPPSYNSMTMMGLSLRSSRSFNSVEQISACVKNGIKVFRLTDNLVGESDLLPDLLLHLLTDKTRGLGSRVREEIIDRASLALTARFHEANRIYFNAVLVDQQNLRSLMVQYAQLTMSSFAVLNGRLSMLPALPYDSAMQISPVVPVSIMFDAGTIVEDSLTFTWIDAADREPFRAVMEYRTPTINSLPEGRTLQVRWANAEAAYDQQEEYDLSAFCTTREQASLTARYLLALRKHVTHTVTFQTSMLYAQVRPGNYIKIYTDQAPYSPALNGVIGPDGTVLSPTTLANGRHDAWVYQNDAFGDPIQKRSLNISSGKEQDPALYSCLFSLVTSRPVSEVYQIEEVSLTDEGVVEITASVFPCDDQGRSLIVKDMTDLSLFNFFD